MSNQDETTANQLTEVFTQALQLFHDRGYGDVQLEMPAMDLLMDHSLSLGPVGLASVLSILAEEGGTVTKPQAAAALSQFLEAQIGMNY
jgi:hypothetical protein